VSQLLPSCGYGTGSDVVLEAKPIGLQDKLYGLGSYGFCLVLKSPVLGLGLES